MLDFASMDDLLAAAEETPDNITPFPQKRIPTTPELGDFEKAHNIVLQFQDKNPAMLAALASRAQALQAACCPPGQSMLSNSSFTGVGIYGYPAQEQHMNCEECKVCAEEIDKYKEHKCSAKKAS